MVGESLKMALALYQQLSKSVTSTHTPS